MRPSVAALVVTVALSAPAAAFQGGPGRPPSDEGDRPPRGGPGEAFKMVDAYILGNMQESLGLTDEQYVKLLPRVQKLQSDRRGLVQRRMRAIGEMRRSLRGGSATEPRLRELLAEVKAVEAEEAATLRRDRDAIDAELSPVQQAKFRVLEHEVERRIRELMGEVRARRRDGGPMRGGRRPPGE